MIDGISTGETGAADTVAAEHLPGIIPDLAGQPLLVSDEQAARMLGISRSLWRRQHSAGRVPMPVKIGRRTLWRREELRDWVSADCPPRHRWQWQGRAARKS